MFQFINDKVHRFRGVIPTIFNPHIVKRGGSLLIDGKVVLKTWTGSQVVLNNNLFLGYNSRGYNGRSTIIHLYDNAKLICNGNARIFYGGDIILFENAKFHIGCSYINSNCTIRVTEELTIGDDCAIACDFTVLDSDFHEINGFLHHGPVHIGDHVWIGSGVTVLPGVHIGEGAVIAAGSVVNKDVAPYSLVAGIPATVKKENIIWRM
nr:acyltransferase [uncultured Blautia sp.]